MRIVALEEHFVIPEALAAWADVDPDDRDQTRQYGTGLIGARLADVGERRLRDMDDTGVDVQVLSLNTPGTQTLAPVDAVRLARASNDAAAAAIEAHPDRFQGFAALPMADHAAAIEELHRSVTELGLHGTLINGRTGSRNIDHPDFRDIFIAASELTVPIYLHPQLPTSAVRNQYYSGLGHEFDEVMAGPGFGWHYETGVQLLRLIFSGIFDECPHLQVITGHWGQLVLFYEERISLLDRLSPNLKRPLREYLSQNVYYTGSGILSPRYLKWTLDVVGVARVMYSTDYPFQFAGDGGARSFLEAAALDGVDREKVAAGNWEKLVSTATTA